MKRTLKFVLAALLVAGVSTGCDKSGEAGGETTTTATAETTVAETTPAAETTAEADTTPDAGAAAAVDEAMYIKAAYEVTCVKAKIEDPEKQKTILAEVYPRYGFETAEAFTAAETSMAGAESVKMALEEKMKNCTVEAAEGFQTAGAADGETAEKPAEETKKAAPKLSYTPGGYSGTVGGGGIEGGTIKLTATDDGKATGVFKGKREGKSFLIALKGEIGKDGKFRLNGGKGNSAQVSGTLKGDKANGKIDAIVNKQKFTVAFSAK